MGSFHSSHLNIKELVLYYLVYFSVYYASFGDYKETTGFKYHFHVYDSSFYGSDQISPLNSSFIYTISYLDIEQLPEIKYLQNSTDLPLPDTPRGPSNSLPGLLITNLTNPLLRPKALHYLSVLFLSYPASSLIEHHFSILYHLCSTHQVCSPIFFIKTGLSTSTLLSL